MGKFVVNNFGRCVDVSDAEAAMYIRQGWREATTEEIARAYPEFAGRSDVRGGAIGYDTFRHLAPRVENIVAGAPAMDSDTALARAATADRARLMGAVPGTGTVIQNTDSVIQAIAQSRRDTEALLNESAQDAPANINASESAVTAEAQAKQEIAANLNAEEDALKRAHEAAQRLADAATPRTDPTPNTDTGNQEAPIVPAHGTTNEATGQDDDEQDDEQDDEGQADDEAPKLTAESPLPGNFPGKKALLAAEPPLDTIGKVMEHDFDAEPVTNVGPATRKDITAFLGTLNLE